MIQERVAKLTTEIARAGLDCVAVIPGPNLYYLSGLSFHLSERPVMAFFRAEGEPVFVVPSLEDGKARQAPYPVRVHSFEDAGGPKGAYADALKEMGLAGDKVGKEAGNAGGKVGVEGRRCRFLELELLRGVGGVEVTNADNLFAGLRMTKDDTELAAMEEAARIAEQAFEATLPFIRPGLTEREVAAELTARLLKAGSEPEFPFFPLVASGPNGADPHLFPTDRKLEKGDLVVIDWGATHQGYVSDITRCVALGQPEPELQKIYDIVRAAARAGRETACPGATGQDVDRATRKLIIDAGYGERFIHRTGHGMGLEGHEEPDMNEGVLIPLEPGMTFTVEPGIYLPGLGGVRIEDDMVITEDGSRSMTGLSRELRVLD